MVRQYQKTNDWEAIANMLSEAGQSLVKAGAEGLMLCANTPHKVYDLVKDQLSVPVLHIADATGMAVQSRGIKKVCFIGTRFTMEEHFITDRINAMGIEVLVPEDQEVIMELHRIILEELTFGKRLPSSKEFVLDTLKEMTDQGAEGIVLGCTEFPLMITPQDVSFPIFDTPVIHALAASDFILDQTTYDRT